MATNTAVAALNKVQYAGLDFPTHFDDLRSELQTKFAADFNDFALSSLAIMLLDITAYGLDSLSFYLDRRATDSYLETAQTRKAVSRLTRQLGYKMGGAISASTDLTVRITSPVNFQVTIPVGFQFLGPNNLIFEAAEAVTFSPRQTASVTIPVYEGETITESFVGDGTANQVFELRRIPTGKSIVQNSSSVLVNGSTYTEVEFLPVTGGQVYEIGYNDDPPTVRFGDGTVATTDIPGPNSTIAVTYVVATGLAGQVNANTITKTVRPLVVNFQTIALAITNPEGAVGGDDPESLDRAKYLAGQVFKTRKVAVTQSDYVALSTAFADPLFGRVATAQAISSRSAATDLELQTLLQDVREVVNPVQSAVASQVTALGVQTAVLDDDLTTVQDTNDAIAVATTDANDAADAALVTLANSSNRAVLASSRCTAGASTVSVITTGASDQLTTDTKTALLALFSNIGTDVGIMQSGIDAAVGNCGAVKDAMAVVGTTVSAPDSLLLTIGNAATSSQAASTTISTVIAPAITLAVAPLASGAVGTDSVNASLEAINDHVDAFLSANCSANLVTVPILTRDANGFYAAPSLGLKQRLQEYLDARKAVTQTVQVTSGERSLIYAILNVQVGVRPGFSENVIKLAVASALDGLLKNREFGADLYRSEITDTVLAINGVAFVNPVITGYFTADSPTVPQTSKLDSFGNLIVLTSEVITKASVTITSTLFTGTT